MTVKRRSLMIKVRYLILERLGKTPLIKSIRNFEHMSITIVICTNVSKDYWTIYKYIYENIIIGAIINQIKL